MTIGDKIRAEKLQYDINREARKTSDKYEYFPGEEIPSDQRRLIEQAKFTYSPLGKALEKQRKNNWRSGIKQVEGLKALKAEENQELESSKRLFPKNMRTNEIKNEIRNGKKLLNKKA